MIREKKKKQFLEKSNISECFMKCEHRVLWHHCDVDELSSKPMSVAFCLDSFKTIDNYILCGDREKYKSKLIKQINTK